ncbi:hypothetical protein BCR43DRAFT_2918 [Syncephalastrum racemosum]|uniref:Importin N-terminal domain-containing protein n=1 Tax=Syncephalastrum racemosum TaxID=13706 RepID=A0A1X2HRS7_SYNRA|nr:hypothetical protein BCR43DRAFT_2918 [Syncephalastrum racemosum]
MDQAVYETLLRVTDSDGGIRSAAEQRLKEFAAAPEYPVSLTRLTVSRDIAVPQRQISFFFHDIYIYTASYGAHTLTSFVLFYHHHHP